MLLDWNSRDTTQFDQRYKHEQSKYTERGCLSKVSVKLFTNESAMFPANDRPKNHPTQRRKLINDDAVAQWVCFSLRTTLPLRIYEWKFGWKLCADNADDCWRRRLSTAREHRARVHRAMHAPSPILWIYAYVYSFWNMVEKRYLMLQEDAARKGKTCQGINHVFWS